MLCPRHNPCSISIVLNSKFSCSWFFNCCTTWLPSNSVNGCSLTTQLAHYAPLILVFSVSLGLTLLQWGADHAALLNSSQTLKLSTMLITFMNLNHSSVFRMLSFVNYVRNLSVFWMFSLLLSLCPVFSLRFIQFFSLVLMSFLFIILMFFFSSCIFTVKCPWALEKHYK